MRVVAQRDRASELGGSRKVLEALADAAARRERHTDAARMPGAAERARRQLGFVAWPAQRSAVAELTARVADALGPAALERALTDAPEPERAVAWVRRARGERKRPKHGWESLTPTELEVVRQVAAGLTNPQIAERLFISRATVKTYLSHVYARLDLRNRPQLAAAAAAGWCPRNRPAQRSMSASWPM